MAPCGDKIPSPALRVPSPRYRGAREWASERIEVGIGAEICQARAFTAPALNSLRLQDQHPLDSPQTLAEQMAEHDRTMLPRVNEFNRRSILFAQSEYHRHALERRVSIHLLAVDLDLHVLACEEITAQSLGGVLDRPGRRSRGAACKQRKSEPGLPCSFDQDAFVGKGTG